MWSNNINMNKESENNIFCIISQDQKEKVNEIIKAGNSIEIHPSKDGIKIYEVKKKIVK